VVPAASGIAQLAELDTLTHLGLVRAFGDLDHAPRRHGGGHRARHRRLGAAVLAGRPAGAGRDLRRTGSLTDAYALIKILSATTASEVPRAGNQSRGRD
jgi:hypothetical protein